MGSFRVNNIMGKALSSDFFFTQIALSLFDFLSNKANCPFLEVIFCCIFSCKSLSLYPSQITFIQLIFC